VKVRADFAGLVAEQLMQPPAQAPHQGSPVACEVTQPPAPPDPARPPAADLSQDHDAWHG
jgi:hypothetical protein